MRKITIAAVVSFAACASGGQEDKDIISNHVGDWEASLSPPTKSTLWGHSVNDNFYMASVSTSTVRGDARARSVGTATDVRVSINGAQSGAQHPWHVHRGVCGDNGAIVGSAGAYPTLTVGTDGTATANATLDVALREKKSYYVNVHHSPADLATIVSCGKLISD